MKHTETVGERWAYSVREVADRLGLGLATVERLVRHGKLASRRIGRRRLIPASAVEALLADVKGGA